MPGYGIARILNRTSPSSRREGLLAWVLGAGAGFLLVAVLSVAAEAQTPARVRLLDTRDGLSHGIVLCALRDSRGFMWFGTRNGLDRYDGHSFRHYRAKPFQANSLPGNVVLALVEDAWGLLWIGTDGGGLCAYDRVTDRYAHFRHDAGDAESLANDIVHALAIDSSGTLWIGTDAGLSRFDLRAYHTSVRAAKDRARFTTLTDRAAPGRRLSSNGVTALFANSDNSLWITTSSGNFDRLDLRSGEIRTFWHSAGGYGKGARPHYRARGMHYCFLALQQHDFAFNDNELLFRYCAADDSIVWMRKLPITRTRGSSLILKAEGSSFTLLTARGLLVVDTLHGSVTARAVLDASDRVYHIPPYCYVAAYTGAEVWIRNGSQGLVYIDLSGSPFAQRLPEVPAGDTQPPTVRALAEDADGRILAGVLRYGIAMIEPGRAESFPILARSKWHRGTESERVVNDIAIGGGGALWLATRANLLHRTSRTGNFHTFDCVKSAETGYVLDGYGFANLFALCADRRGTLWVGGARARRGVLYTLDLDGEKLTALSDENTRPGLFGSGVWTIVEDSDGTLWFGAQNGLHSFRPATAEWKHYTHSTGDTLRLIHDEIWSLHDDGRGTLWIGTLGGGLDALEKSSGRFRHVTTQQGLASDLILGLVGDARGSLWMSTGAGITCYDPRTREVRNFRGSAIEAVMPFSFGSALRAGSGHIYFGGNAGVLEFHPDSVEALQVPPRIVFSNIEVFGVAVPGDVADGDTVEVPYTSNLLTISCSALDFRNPEGMRYAYRMDGRGNAWIPLGSQHQLTLAGLEPGVNTVHVRGANSAGEWNERGVLLFIRVVPPWHMTLWFRGGAGLLIVALLAGTAVRRVRASQRREQTSRRLIESELKALRAQMNPHFIFNSLNAVQSYMLASQQEKANSYLSKFAKLMRMILENSSRPTITLGEELHFLRTYVELESMRFEGRFQYEFEVDPTLDAALRLPSMLIQPFVENAFRHGLVHLPGGGSLVIALRNCGDSLLCTVEDNGIGREKAGAIRERQGLNRASLGIAVTSERLHLLNAKRHIDAGVQMIDLRDQAGEPAGTRVEIVIPFEAPPSPETTEAPEAL